MHGEYYEYQEVVTVVETCPRWTTFITLTVTNIYGQIKTVQAMIFGCAYRNYELLEWRFKPDIMSHL